MRSNLLNIILVILLFFLPKQADAEHIVGGDIYYDYNGGNSYTIYVTVYRDCLSNGAWYDSPLNLGVFRTNSNSLYNTYSVPFTTAQVLPVVFNNPCVVPPMNICVQTSTYVQTVTLPPIPGGYTVTYTRCCRGPNINNLQFPEDQGLTLSTRIPGMEDNNYQNSSPRFVGYPPLLLCNNEDLVFNHSATDPDGDELVYSLAAPFQGGTSWDPAPSPPPAPPHQPVVFAPNYSQTVPLGPGSTISIDQQTGVLTASPNLSGRFVVGVRVSEYRNGVLLSSVVRDFIFQVFNCQITMQAIVPPQDQMQAFAGFCTGNNTVQFTNNSYGGTNYIWDFDDPASGANNTSTAFAPSHTFSDTGVYQVRLIVNPGWNCTDTADVTIYIYDEFNVIPPVTEPQCLTGNSFNLTAVSDGPPTTQYSWEFGGNAITPQGNGPNVNVIYTAPGTYTVTLTGQHGVCEDQETFNIVVTPSPVANFTLSPNYRCEGLDVVFTNTSTNAPTTTWTFGDGGNSSEFNITHSYNQPGEYTVTLIVDSNNGCTDTLRRELVVNERIDLGLEPQPPSCISENIYSFIGEVSGPIGADYWITITDSVSEDFPGTSVLDYVFENVGLHPVTLHGTFQECASDTTIFIRIIGTPIPDFKLADGLKCVPYTAEFVNLSMSETPLNYQWDFGNGETSGEEHPTTIYVDSGLYDVTLVIWSLEGCLDTLRLTKEDYVWVHPKPEARFMADRTEVEYCDASIQFTNLSIGDLLVQYDFDDKGARSNDQNPLYYFRNEGEHYVQLFVQSAAGCRDTASMNVYVEPFTVYAPNTFTPDGDEFNDNYQFVLRYEPFDWHAQILNRWGEIIYESFDYQSKWDGTYNGKKVQDGTYTYVIKYQPCSQVQTEKIVKTGYINILR